MLIAETSPKGGGNLQKDTVCQYWHPMAAMREPQPTQPLAQCMADMVMPRNALALLYGDNHVCYHVFQNPTLLVETTACDDLPFRSVSPFWSLSPILAWFSEKWFKKRTCYPSNSWKSQVIRKAFPQQPPAFANEMVSNTTFPGWKKKTTWAFLRF